MVQYVRDLTDAQSECWVLNPLRADFAGALAVAREGLNDYPDASGFRILDEGGAVITEESHGRS